ncbi:YerC/YecD family TrpR-related protein [Pelosinus sp. sgz500959]|uniref:YerC/YecD family TrpR-related protein n=1 Tax=Pelosinus sp. sgz500959 TaxID=3242472 RepID=UPI00366B4432
MATNPKLKGELADRLFQGILLLENQEECYQFFEDICTISELKSLAQRLEVAFMLKSGHTYDEIVAKTGASTATISRVKRCLNYGADGYKLILERVEIQNAQTQSTTKVDSDKKYE